MRLFAKRKYSAQANLERPAAATAQSCSKTARFLSSAVTTPTVSSVKRKFLTRFRSRLPSLPQLRLLCAPITQQLCFQTVGSWSLAASTATACSVPLNSIIRTPFLLHHLPLVLRFCARAAAIRRRSLRTEKL